MSISSFAAQRKERLLSLLFLTVLSVSVLVAVVAAIRNTAGKVLAVAGALDVALALAALGLFVALTATTPTERIRMARSNAYTRSAQLSSVTLLLLLFYFIGVRVNWEILLVGLGWRYWLLITALPYLIAAFHKDI